MRKLLTYASFVFIAVALIGAPLLASAQATAATTLECSITNFGTIIPCMMKYLANGVLSLTGYLLYLGAVFLNLAMNFTLNLSIYAANIDGAWRVIRDLINIAFIFGLLWIAIQTILELGDWKRPLTSIIIAALLINFSLFFTKVIIDASNIVALQFYTAISGGKAPVPLSAAALFAGGGDAGISDQFMDRLKITSIFAAGGNVGLSAWNITLIGLFGSVFMIITAAVFFIAGLMLLARSAILLLLMITSPIGFVGTWLPRLKEYRDLWWSQLVNQSLFAPVFLLLVWGVLAITAVNPMADIKLIDGTPTSFASALTGNASSMGIIFNFLLMIALIVAALHTAQKLSGTAGAKFAGWSQKALGTVAGGVGGFAFRNTAGRLASKLASTQGFKDFAASNRFFIGKGLYSMTEGLAKSSGDIRSARIPAMGELVAAGGAKIDFGKPSGKGGYEQTLKSQVKARTDFVKGLETTYDEAGRRRQLATEGRNLGEIDRIINEERESSKSKSRFRKAIAIDEMRTRGPTTLWMVARKNKMASNAALRDLNKGRKERLLEELTAVAREEAKEETPPQPPPAQPTPGGQTT